MVSLYHSAANYLHLYSKLAWEPSSDKVAKSNSGRLPALERCYRKFFFAIKDDLKSGKFEANRSWGS